VFRNGVPDSVNTYNTPVTTENYTLDQAVYIQDKWAPIKRLTLNLGLRAQKTFGWVPAGCQTATIFIAARCFDKVDGVPDWFDVAPRFGLVYDVFGDGRTAVKFSVNRYYLTNGVAHTSRVNPLRLTSDTRAWTDRNGDEIPQLDELGPSTGFNLGTTNRYSPNVRRPYANEFLIELERQLPYDVVASASFIRRETRREIGSKNMLVSPESYIPLVVTERNSGQTVTVYNLAPSLRGRFDFLFDNFPGLNSAYNGADFTVKKRLSNHWMVLSGLSIGKNVGDIYGTADLNNPNNTFRRGVIEFDVPVSFKTSAAYQFPYDISLSANVQHFTGFPEEDQVTVGSNTVALTQVTQTIDIAPRGTHRLPSVNVGDFAVKKLLRFSRGITAEPALELFNVTNANTVQGRVTTLGPAYQRATSIMRGRMLRVGVNVKF
jgi:hypothetical protein